jgi:hypothetical protein
MAAVNIAWGDGTGDQITVTYNGDVGVSQATVSSDPNNTLNDRTKIIYFKDFQGTIRANVTVVQTKLERAFSSGFSSGFS